MNSQATAAMRSPRLKLRTLVALVAVATVAVGGVEYRRRAATFWVMAEREAQKASTARASAELPRDYLEILPGLARGHRARLVELGSRSEQLRLDAAPDELRVMHKHRTDEISPDELRVMHKHLTDEISEERAILQRIEAEEIPGTRSVIQACEREASFHARRRAAFLRCARYPWLSSLAE